MAGYIVDWETKWKKITDEQNKKGRAQTYLYQRLLQWLPSPVLNLADGHS